MAVEAGDIVWRILGDLDGIKAAYADAKAEADKTFGAISGVIGPAMTAAGAAITGTLTAAVLDFANTGDAIKMMSDKTGMSTEAVSELKHAFEMTGGSLETVGTATKKFATLLDEAGSESKEFGEKQAQSSQKSGEEMAKLGSRIQEASMKLREMQAAGTASASEMMAQRNKISELGAEYQKLKGGAEGAATATGKNTETLTRLGLSVTELKAMEPEKAFIQMMYAVADIKDPLERAAVAQDVFGRAGMDMLPLLASGSAGIEQLASEAHDLGLVFDAEAAAQADQFNDDLERLGKSVRGVGFELAKALVPALIEFMQSAKDVVLTVTGWIKANPELAATITAVTAVVGALMLVVGPLLMVLPGIIAALPLVGAAFAALAGPIGIAIAAIAAVAAGAYLLITNWENIPAALGAIWNAIKNAATESIQFLGRMIGEGMRGIVWMFTNPLDAIKMAWSGLVEFFRAVWAGIAAVFMTGWEIVKGIYDALGQAVDWIKSNLGIGIEEGMTGGPPGLATGGEVARGGWALVGERGPELVQLPSRSTVYDAGQTAQALSGGGQGGATINITNHFGRDSVRSDDDIREIDRRLAGLVRQQMTGMGFA